VHTKFIIHEPLNKDNDRSSFLPFLYNVIENSLFVIRMKK
jgi:hypothetical protein